MGYFWQKIAPMESIKIKIDQIKEWSNEFRLIYPEAVRNMELSMQSNGQLQPLILLKNDDGYYIIDGIKRYRAALALGLTELQSLVFEVTMVMAKTMIIHYNRHSSSLSMYEQGLIVRSLVHDHGLSQKEVAQALRQSHSWVCRRLSLVERLLPEVQDALRMGSITVSHGRELVKLPRGNQGPALEIIIKEGLNCRESAIVVEKLLKAKSPKEAEYLYSQCREVIRQAMHGEKLYDSRLSVHGNRLLKARELLRLQINILSGALKSEHTAQLPAEQQAMVLPAMNDLVAPMNQLTEIIYQTLTSYER
ncbi:MAG: ParB/RepB/Spo0J family partition protein [Anaerolineaceae bacterium]|nr:ParB/RepB/Spo0J family partition protein [Anaerolineaceae bacterium]